MLHFVEFDAHRKKAGGTFRRQAGRRSLSLSQYVRNVGAKGAVISG